MNGKSIAFRVIENCTFPADFTDADKDKFAAEVASEAKRYLPDGDTENLISDVTGTSRSLTVKFDKKVTKPEAKGEKIQYTFRLSVWLAVASAMRGQKLTGFSFPVDLTGKDTFWKNWKRAEIVTAQSNS